MINDREVVIKEKHFDGAKMFKSLILNAIQIEQIIHFAEKRL